VILADVVASSSTERFVQGRDKRLRRLSRRHTDAELIAAPYTVTAWDEFQTFTWHASSVPQLLLELRQEFSPWQITVGVGQGEIEGWRSQRPINESVGGQAFERAREALETLKRPRDKYRRLTRFETGNPKHDEVLNLIYGLHDTLVEGVTERQWETIGLAMRGLRHETIAKKLGISPSTVSRNLQRGHYWQMQETRSIVSELIRA
jgi:hypothetical protein